MKNKLVIYTALFGNYDDLIEPREKYEGCDFVCFTDQKHLKSNIWKIKIIEESDLPLNMMNRRYKMFPHLFLSEYEQSLYVDANIYIKKSPLELAEKYLTTYDIAIPKHYERECLYEESIEVLNRKIANAEEVKYQMNKYRKENFPEKFGFAENNIIFRNHTNEPVINLMNQWWKELNDFTKRDQLSLMYLIWKNKIDLKLIDENARGGKYFKLQLHAANYKQGTIGYLLNIKNIHIINYPNGSFTKINMMINNFIGRK